MTDFAISIFRLFNAKGYSIPQMNIGYIERETGLEWRITCGGSRAYLVRFGNQLEDNLDEQAADSHFMIRRVTSSLLLSGLGLFQAEAMGRLIFKNVCGKVTWDSHLDGPDPFKKDDSYEEVKKVYDWFGALCKNNILRRAADDAHIALTHPHEALIYVYRGLEWLKEGLVIGWEVIAKDIGVSNNDIRQLKKNANRGTGVRHATKNGKKLRASFENYTTWVCGLIDAINAARKRLDSEFKEMTPKEVGDAVMKATPLLPYP
jgi:hypothetical protein